MGLLSWTRGICHLDRLRKIKIGHFIWFNLVIPFPFDSLSKIITDNSTYHHVNTKVQGQRASTLPATSSAIKFSYSKLSHPLACKWSPVCDKLIYSGEEEWQNMNIFEFKKNSKSWKWELWTNSMKNYHSLYSKTLYPCVHKLVICISQERTVVTSVSSVGTTWFKSWLLCLLLLLQFPHVQDGDNNDNYFTEFWELN